MTEEQLKQLIEFLNDQVEVARKLIEIEVKLGRTDGPPCLLWSGREACANDLLRMIDRIKDDREH